MAKSEQAMENKQIEGWKMCLEEMRLQSYKDWPTDDKWECTPEKMAAAGFYHCPTENEPDAVRCFMCQKELDGWEAGDDPWEEHRRHSPKCPFLKLKEPMEQLTLQDFILLEAKRHKITFEKKWDAKSQEFQIHAKAVLEEMSNLV